MLLLSLNVGAADSGEPEATAFPQDAAKEKIWVHPMDAFEHEHYRLALDHLIPAFESATGLRIEPGEKRRAGIKIYSNSGPGIATPTALVESMITFLESRGFQKEEIFILDLNADQLTRAGFIRSRADTYRQFHGVPVLPLDEGRFYDPIWFYDSPMPSQYLAIPRNQLTEGLSFGTPTSWTLDDRKSFLPIPLLLDADFWINLPMITDHPQLGINGTMANATLWNVSNHHRFLNHTAGASAAIAEIAAIPELRRGWVFSIVTMEKLQFMGGPIFNSNYVRSYPEVFLSTNAVALDRIFLERINRARESRGFTAVSPIPPVFEYARSLDLGDFERDTFEIVVLPQP
jgi:hypothetical protein